MCLRHGRILISRDEVTVGLGDSGTGDVIGGERVGDRVVVSGHASRLGRSGDSDVRVRELGEAADILPHHGFVNNANGSKPKGALQPHGPART